MPAIMFDSADVQVGYRGFLVEQFPIFDAYLQACHRGESMRNEL